MRTSEPNTIDELIADCAAIPTTLAAHPVNLPQARTATSWSVDEVCHAQVVDLDEYV